MKKVDTAHFARFKMPHSVKCRGNDVYFAVKTADIEANAYKNDLYVLKEGKVKRLTALGDMGSFTLTEAGILFAAARTKEEKERQEKGIPATVFYLLPYDGGEALPAFTVNASVTDIYPAGESRYFLEVREVPAWKKALAEAEGNEEKAAAALKEEADYRVIDEIPFYMNGAGFTNAARRRVCLFTEGTLTPLTEEGRDCGILSFANGKLLVAEGAYEKGKMSLFDRLYLVDGESLEKEDITFGPAASHYGAWALADGSVLALVNTADRFGMNQNPGLYRYAKGQWTPVYTEGLCSFGNSVGSDVKAEGPSFGGSVPVRDGIFWFTDTVRDHTAISGISLETGEICRLNDNQMNITGFDFTPEGFVFTALEGNGGCELYCADRKGEIKKLTDFNTALCEEYGYSSPEYLPFTNKKGETIDGWVIRPAGYEEGKKYPAILDIHGGPKTVYGTCYFHEMQLWAAEGYFVFFCNPTGGDGRGDVFADIRGVYGGPEYEEIMLFTDRVLESYPAIDEKRVGVTGGSYGGFMTNWIIGHTGRFAAAASQRSISNWLSFYETSDIGYFFAADQVDGTPWTAMEKLWDQSPLKYADKVTTPTLFIHSDEDYRCPLSEGMQMFTAIKDHGVDARMCIFKGENHELSRSGKPKHRIRRLAEITGWFDKYLKKEEEKKNV